MKTVKEIIEMLGFGQKETEELLLAEKQVEKKEIEAEVRRLTEPEEWEGARIRLKELLEPDEKGIKMLCCMLKAAAYTLEEYKRQGMTEEIFTETMKCFTRFTQEHKVSFGCFGFDRDFWTGRQLSMQLFRLGALEYEKLEEKGKRTVSVHIPSDAALTEEELDQSFHMAADFFRRFDSRYAEVPYTCHSWLLSPALCHLLPKDSRILAFQRRFELQQVDEESNSALEWVYKRKDIPTKDLPENTSLQRKMKEYLLSGKNVGDGYGVLKQ